jgi:hypothetical protein
MPDWRGFAGVSPGMPAPASGFSLPAEARPARVSSLCPVYSQGFAQPNPSEVLPRGRYSQPTQPS